MRPDEQLLRDEIESTRTTLDDTAQSLYRAIGQSAVIEWGHAVGLSFARCAPCERDTPTIGDSLGSVCAVCGTLREEA